jgi:hypothetical protein
MKYAAAHIVLAKAYRYGWSCEKVALELEALGFSEKQVTRLMNTGALK